MLKVTKVEPNRIDIDLSGSIDAVEMRVALDELISLSSDVTDGTMLYTITDFAMPTLSAFGVELTRLPALFGLLGKYHRMALLTDTQWLQYAAEFEGFLIPGLEVKSFDLADRAVAENWLRNGG